MKAWRMAPRETRLVFLWTRGASNGANEDLSFVEAEVV